MQNLPLPSAAWPAELPPQVPRPAGAGDFDFLLGRWGVEHRRPSGRPGCDEGVVFAGTLDVHPVLGGLGHLDDHRLDDPVASYRATTLRLFDAGSGLWLVRWIDERIAGIDVPFTGRFEGRVGRFERDERIDGRASRVRFTYEDCGPGRARWDRAVSADGGATWATDRTMVCTREAGDVRGALVNAPTDDGRADFDFFVGDWRVRHRKLKRRLVGETAWDTFDGVSAARPILGGLGNYDDNVLDGPGLPYRALTLRRFDPATRLWSIWWVDTRFSSTTLDPPMVGRFDDGVGRFFCDDTFEDRPIRVRYLWSEIERESLRWQQAFSPDDGRTWETNWDMRFTRVAR